MAKPMSWGPSRSGYYEVVRGANLVQEEAFPCAANSGNDSGVEDFAEGEWAVVDAAGKAIKSTAGAGGEISAYPVVTGYERADVRGSGSQTLGLGNGYWLETSGFDLVNKAVDDYPAGTELSVRAGKLYPAATGDYILAIVKRAPVVQQTYAQKALLKTGFTTVLVEVGYRGIK